MLPKPLPQEFYDHPADEVARSLLGMWLVRSCRRGITGGRICETEAYLGFSDSASHSFRGRNRKNKSMFGAAGRAYVYPIHSRHCVNAVTQAKGVPTAVLIRAIEPRWGAEIMAQRRGRQQLLELARGPGRLCQALAIDRTLDGWPLTKESRIWIGMGSPIPHEMIGVSAHVGVTSAQEQLLRYFIDGDPFVSGPRKLHRRPIKKV